MRVEDIMNSPVTVTRNTVKVTHLKELFKRKNINASPILEEDGTISGIVTSSDLLKFSNEELTVADIATKKVHICLKNNQVKDAAKLMLKHHIHHLVVMEEGEVVGIISSLDIIKHLIN